MNKEQKLKVLQSILRDFKTMTKEQWDIFMEAAEAYSEKLTKERVEDNESCGDHPV